MQVVQLSINVMFWSISLIMLCALFGVRRWNLSRPYALVLIVLQMCVASSMVYGLLVRGLVLLVMLVMHLSVCPGRHAVVFAWRYFRLPFMLI